VLGLNAEWHALGYTNPLIHVPTLVAFYALGTDDGVGTGPAGMSRPVAGFGLRGMAERVESIGGTLATGPKAGGGFEVRAALPVPPSSG
jgi:signal transduction histidine kinase